jgi:hypothetical protein
MAKLYVSGAPHRAAMELSEELAPSRVSPAAFKQAAQPFVRGMQLVMGAEVQNAVAVEGVAAERRKQLAGWITAHEGIFRKAGLEPRIEDIDGVVLRCLRCFDERVLPAGQMPSVKAMRCPKCNNGG